VSPARLIDVNEPVIRRELREGDPEAIAALHRRIYGPEYGTNDTFVVGVASTLRAAREAGWPRGGGVWLVEQDRELWGSLGLTAESQRCGRVRWFVLDSRLRGRGLGGQLVGELVALARTQGMVRLELDTFSELTAAAHIYRSHGFAVVDEQPRVDWRPAHQPMTYQHYVADLR
jgi:GNAT superfamily N-acetyltransferase